MILNFRLHVFLSVARHLSFSRAAQSLLLTQPAVTQQIKALEDELSAPLFDRTAGRISLTPAGHALLPYAQQLGALSDQAVAAVAQATGHHAGTLALGASQTISQYLLPSLIAGFLATQPRIQVTVTSGNTDHVLDQLAARRIHLALIEGPVHRTDLRIEPFMDDHLVLVVPSTHPWANAQITPDQLATQPLLLRELGSGSRRVVQQALTAARLKLKSLHLALELDSNEGLLSAVEAGLGITFVSRWAARTHLALGTLAVARVPGLRLSRRFSMAWPAGPEPTGATQAFRAFLHHRALDAADRPKPTTKPKPGPAAKPHSPALRNKTPPLKQKKGAAAPLRSPPLRR